MNRYGRQFSYTLEQDQWTIYGRFLVGSTGAVTSGSVKGGGVSGVVRNGTGDYTITLTESFNCVLEFRAFVISASGNSGIANAEAYDATPANFQSDFRTNKTISFKTLDYAGSAADPTAGGYLVFVVRARNSNNNPFGFSW